MEANIDYSTEIWKPIKGFEGRYEISSHGRLKSIYGKSKLTFLDVVKFRRLSALGFDCVRISKMYGLNRRTVYDAVKGKTWTHI